MRAKRHPINDGIDHPLFCHLAASAAVVASFEALARKHGHAACGEDEASATFPTGPAAGGCFAALRAALRLPRVDSATAYAALVAKAVTFVTVACRRTRGPRLDPAVGALRNTGLFVRPHAVRAGDDPDDGAARLVPSAVIVATPSPKQ
jgi:hypothetical protein